MSIRSCSILAFVVALVCLGQTRNAYAEDWSIDAGAGARWLRGPGLGPLARLGVAYQLNESLFASLAGAVSHHERAGVATTVWSAAAGLGAQFDVTRWVPALSLEAGAYDFEGGAPLAGIRGVEFGVGMNAALDYLLSHEASIGAVCQGDLLLSTDPPVFPAIDALLRFRYRWGW